jgi:hypothetical protein
MKFGNREIMDLLVFDLNENLVTKLDTLKESRLFKDEGDTYYLFAKDALLDENILKFIGYQEEIEVSDMKSYLNDNKDDRTITFNSKRWKQCKLLAVTLGRQQTDCIDKKFIFEFPQVDIMNNFSFHGVTSEVSAFDLVFRINKYNDNGDVFKLHIKG